MTDRETLEPDEVLLEPPASQGGQDARHGRRIVDRESAPGLARLAVGAWWQTNLWTARTAVKATRRLARAAASGESAGALIDEARHEAATIGRRLLGIGETDGEERPARSRSADFDDDSLRSGWRELVDMSTDVNVAEMDGHPAFAGILRELHPDEARILRLLAADGPQPAVDVRTWRPLGLGSQTVAPGLNMIGRHAGCLMPERVPVYLSNLFRLGLIWFSRDQIPEIGPYQVLEAQPEVIEALKRAGRGTTVRRSVRLTPFGDQFCAAALPGDEPQFDAVAIARPLDEAPPPRAEGEPGP